MKKMLKRSIGVLLAAGMAFSLAACSSGSGSAPKETQAAASGTEAVSETEAVPETEVTGAVEETFEDGADIDTRFFDQYAAARLFHEDGTEAYVTVDLHGGCSADFARGAVYFYDQQAALSDYEDVTAFAFIRSKAEYNDFVDYYKDDPAFEQTDTYAQITEEDGTFQYWFPVEGEICFSVHVKKGADIEDVIYRFVVETDTAAANITAYDSAAVPFDPSADDTDHFAAATLFLDDGKEAYVTVDVSGGCCVEFARGAVYFYDNKTTLSENDEVAAFGFIRSQAEYDDFVADCEGNESFKQTDAYAKVVEEDGSVNYWFPVADEIYFSIHAGKDSDPDSVIARFEVSPDSFEMEETGETEE